MRNRKKEGSRHLVCQHEEFFSGDDSRNNGECTVKSDFLLVFLEAAAALAPTRWVNCFGRDDFFSSATLRTRARSFGPDRTLIKFLNYNGFLALDR